MCKKTLILSSSGLKNIIPEAIQEEEFQFIFGNQSICTKNVFAEFISPKVSKIHKLDPTIRSICFLDKYKDISITEKTISNINLLLSGESIEINEEESIQLKVISILLDNEELFCKLNEIFTNEINESNIDQYLNNLTILSQISPSFDCFNYDSIIELISSYFYLIDKNQLKKLAKPILLSIISSQNLVVESEDSLLDFINEIFGNNEEDDDEIEKNYSEMICFYEKVEFSMLSEAKFEKFVNDFRPLEMTCELWSKLRVCFYMNKAQRQNEVDKKRYSVFDNKFEYDGNSSHAFCGIIDHLTKESGGNVCDNGTVKVTSSSTNGSSYPRNAVDVHNEENYFNSNNNSNSWLKYDFIGRKVSPSAYSIRTRHDCNYNHPRNWVIEGSNTDSDSDWTILDSHQDDTSFMQLNVTCTFDISEKKESYRYLRIRQTGYNNCGGNNHLCLSALEFFGYLIES